MESVSFSEERLRNGEGPHSLGSYVRENKISRNDTCPCGSGKKFKRCCIHQEQHQPKDYVPVNAIGKKSLKVLTNVNKLQQLRNQCQSDLDFFRNIFFPIWNSLGNKYIQNFQQVWSFVSRLRIGQFNVKGGNKMIPLMRCMTFEEYQEMKSTGLVQAPSWTSNPDYVMNFRNFPIFTRSTKHVVIVLALFDSEDIVYAHEIESEFFMRKGASPLYNTVLIDWYPEDIEQVYETSIENLYITHEECGNSFDNYISVFQKRGVSLTGFVNENGVYCNLDVTGKKSEFIANYLDEINALEEMESTHCYV